MDNSQASKPEDRKPLTAMEQAQQAKQRSLESAQESPPSIEPTPDEQPTTAEVIAQRKAEADALPKKSLTEMTDMEDFDWRPASLLDVPQWVKDMFPDHGLRWCSKREIDKKLLEHWTTVVVDGTKVETEFRPTMVDGARTDSTVQVREMILMKLPRLIMAKRTAYFEGRTKDLLQSKLEADNEEAQRDGSKHYGALGEGGKVLKEEASL